MNNIPGTSKETFICKPSCSYSKVEAINNSDVIDSETVAKPDSQQRELEILILSCANSTEPLDKAKVDKVVKAMNSANNGSFITLNYFAYRIQSPFEKDAYHSLLVLEMIIKNGGYKAVDELGRFRFLNELIKAVSPKHLGSQTAPLVKNKIIELIFLWSMEYKEFPKILEAYQMLKVQKIVTEDPVHILKSFRPLTPPPPRPKDAIFDNEQTAQTLRNLISSEQPEKLETANRMIKMLAKQSENRIQFRAIFNQETENIINCARLLNEMLINANVDLEIDQRYHTIINSGASEDEIALMKELLTECEKARIKLIQFSSEVDRSQNEDMSRLINTADITTAAITACRRYLTILNNPKLSMTNANIMLSDPGYGVFNRPGIDSDDDTSLESSSPARTVQSKNLNTDRLVDLNSPPFVSQTETNKIDKILNEEMDKLRSSNLSAATTSTSKSSIESFKSTEYGECSKTIQKPKATTMDDLMSLNEMLMSHHLDNSIVEKLRTEAKETQKVKENSAKTKKLDEIDTKSFDTNESLSKLLSLIQVPYESIIPNEERPEPMVIFDQDNVRLQLFYTGNQPHPNVLVLFLTFSNLNIYPITRIQLMAAVPKKMKVKLQPRTGSSLPAYVDVGSAAGSSFVPAWPNSFISQIMLVAFNDEDSFLNFTLEKTTPECHFRLKFKLTFQMCEKQFEHLFYFDCNFIKN